jgi:hypothetical protein
MGPDHPKQMAGLLPGTGIPERACNYLNIGSVTPAATSASGGSFIRVGLDHSG